MKKSQLLDPASKLELINKVGLRINAELELSELLELIVESIKKTLHHSYCAVLLKEGDELIVRAVTEYPAAIIGKKIPLGTGISGKCALEKKIYRIDDISQCDFYLYLGDRIFKSELDIPIVYQNQLLGVLNTQDTRKSAFSDGDIEILKVLSSQIAVAIRNAQVHDQLKLVQKIGTEMVSITNEDTLLAMIVTETRQTFHYDSCAVFLAEREQLVLKAVSGEFPENTVGLRIPLKAGVTGKCARLKKIVNIGDIPKHPEYIPSGIEGVQSEIALPLLFEGRLLGVLTIESRKKNAFTEDDIRLLSILSSQVAVAIRNAQVHDQLKLVQKIGTEMVSITNEDTLLAMIVTETRQTLHYDSCAVFLAEREQLVLKAVSGEFPENTVGLRIPLKAGVTGKCARLKKIVNIGDIPKHPEYIPSGIEGVQSEIALPLLFEGRLLGVLTIESRKKNAFTEDDIRLLSILSSQIAATLHNVRMHRHLELVLDIGIRLGSVRKLDELLSKVINETKNTLHYFSCAIFLVEGELIILKAITEGYPRDIIGMRIPIGRGITGKCAQQREILNIGDISLFPDFIPTGIKGIMSEIAVPILFEDRLLGVLAIEGIRKNAFDQKDVRLLTFLSAQIAIAIHNAQLYSEIEKLAITDPLTGLYNYRYCYQRLSSEIARSLRYHRPLALILIDIDNFKLINDQFGHITGDQVLKWIAGTIKNTVRRYDEKVIMKEVEIDIAARYGGEEFIVILPETDLKGGIAAAERLRQKISQPIAEFARRSVVEKLPERVTGSLGVTVYQPRENIETLIKRVDQAMYRAKRDGKNRVAIIE